MLRTIVSELKQKKTVNNSIKVLTEEEQKKVSGGYSHKDHARNSGGPNGNGPGRNRP